MFPINNETLNDAISRLAIIDITSATIRQICSLAAELEGIAEEKMVHLEMGNPGLPAEQIGIEAEIESLKRGVANTYPNIAGIPELKLWGERFIKAFLDLDVPKKGIIPTVGSMQGSFTLMLLLGQRLEGKDTMLFLNPGFPAQRNQAKLLGLKEEAFDIYAYRGKKLEEKLESILSKGNITGMIYSNPNNPAWTNLTEEELEIIGRLATKYDVIVVEDLAYFGMDFRNDVSHPGEPPYGATVGRYTDNYILLLSGSKIFSYAGQRIALVCMSEKVFNRRYDFFEKFYEMPSFGDAYIYGVLYCASSGTAHSAQYALAAMMEQAVKGNLPFIDHCREYAHKANRAKKLFLDNGFHIVYEFDGDQPISDGFFFTVGYDGMSAQELQLELLRYGVAAISLISAGSEQPGVRVCVSMLRNEDDFASLEKYLRQFNSDHK
ncbi:MAG: pyridoxal phosphate-dependent aminotransferase [Muribaculaceae bacterium]|nr:pyridoxal phosphate-dependent aminotransferase [Muribaculaceae bacterium]MDE6682237.1 pyridoxal phosphate-dependent aminotransferase [Muribaculaceae bacterium]